MRLTRISKLVFTWIFQSLATHDVGWPTVILLVNMEEAARRSSIASPCTVSKTHAATSPLKSTPLHRSGCRQLSGLSSIHALRLTITLVSASLSPTATARYLVGVFRKGRSQPQSGLVLWLHFLGEVFQRAKLVVVEAWILQVSMHCSWHPHYSRWVSLNADVHVVSSKQKLGCWEEMQCRPEVGPIQGLIP